jgi:hypothetical protein
VSFDKIFANKKSRRERILGRPKHRWEDNIKMVLTEMEGVV